MQPVDTVEERGSLKSTAGQRVGGISLAAPSAKINDPLT
jgi:hypothetical protein